MAASKVTSWLEILVGVIVAAVGVAAAVKFKVPAWTVNDWPWWVAATGAAIAVSGYCRLRQAMEESEQKYFKG